MRNDGTSTKRGEQRACAAEVITSHVKRDGGGSHVTLTIATTGFPSTTRSTRLAGKITRSTPGLSRTSWRGVGSIQWCDGRANARSCRR